MSFKKKAINSSAWSMANSLVNKIVTLIVYTIIARFVSIEEFGYVAFSLLFIEFLSLFISTGFKEYLISKESWDHDLASATFWIVFCLFICISLLIITVGAPTASYFYSQELADILMAMCFIPFSSALNCIPNIKLQRDLLYKKLSLIRMFSIVSGGFLGVYLAVNNYGAWSLVYSKLLQAMLTTILLWNYSNFFPSFVVKKKYFIELYRYSLPLLGTEVLAYWYPRVADLITSVFLGPAAYALIDVGRKIIMSLYQIMLKPLQTLSFSAITRANKEKKNLVYINISCLISFFVCPVILVLGFHSENIIPMLFGDKWLQSAELMGLYSYAVFAICSFWFSGALFLSHGYAKLFFYLNLFSMLAMIILALITVQYGLITLVIGQVIAEYVISTVKLITMVYAFKFGYIHFLRFQLSILFIGIVNSLLFYHFGNDNFTSYVQLFYSLIFWFVCYYFLILILDRKYFIKCYRLVFCK